MVHIHNEIHDRGSHSFPLDTLMNNDMESAHSAYLYFRS